MIFSELSFCFLLKKILSSKLTQRKLFTYLCLLEMCWRCIKEKILKNINLIPESFKKCPFDHIVPSFFLFFFCPLLPLNSSYTLKNKHFLLDCVIFFSPYRWERSHEFPLTMWSPVVLLPGRGSGKIIIVSPTIAYPRGLWDIQSSAWSMPLFSLSSRSDRSVCSITVKQGLQ